MSSSPDLRHLAAVRLGRLRDSLDFQIRRALRSPDADSIHDLRTATRRFSQALVIFGSSLERESGRIRRALKPVMERSGKVRDLDVALKIIRKNDETGGEIIAGKIERKRAKAQRELAGILQRLVERGATAGWKPRADAGKPAAALAADAKRAVLATAEKLFRRGAKASGKHPSGRLHKLRIAAKKPRYTLELGSRSSAKYLDLLEELQSELGHIHDLENVGELLAGFAGSKELRAHLERRRRELLREFRKFWNEEFAGRKRQDAWMRSVLRFADSLGTSGRKARRAG